MKRFLWLVVPAVVLAFAAPVFAGEGHAKCTASTQECLDMYAAKLQNKGWLGVKMDYTETHQLEITEVIPDSPAEGAGLSAGDILFAINGVEYTEANEEAVHAQWKKSKPGAEFSFTILQGGKDKKDINVTLAKMPEDVMYAMIGQHMVKDHSGVEQAEEE